MLFSISHKKSVRVYKQKHRRRETPAVSQDPLYYLRVYRVIFITFDDSTVIQTTETVSWVAARFTLSRMDTVQCAMNFRVLWHSQWQLVLLTVMVCDAMVFTFPEEMLLASCVTHNVHRPLPKSYPPPNFLSDTPL